MEEPLLHHALQVVAGMNFLLWQTITCADKHGNSVSVTVQVAAYMSLSGAFNVGPMWGVWSGPPGCSGGVVVDVRVATHSMHGAAV